MEKSCLPGCYHQPERPGAVLIQTESPNQKESPHSILCSRPGESLSVANVVKQQEHKKEWGEKKNRGICSVGYALFLVSRTFLSLLAEKPGQSRQLLRYFFFRRRRKEACSRQLENSKLPGQKLYRPGETDSIKNKIKFSLGCSIAQIVIQNRFHHAVFCRQFCRKPAAFQLDKDAVGLALPKAPEEITEAALGLLWFFSLAWISSGFCRSHNPIISEL